MARSFSNGQRIALVLLTAFLASPTNAGADQIRSGSLLYGANCRACHGDAGAGGIGPRLSGPGNAATWDYQRFRAAILGDFTRPVSSVMPHFGLDRIAPTGKAPTNEELQAIQRYLASMK